MAIIKICGVLVDILVEIAPDAYKSYATTDKKEVKQLLVQCQNALYGTMVASLLYYRKFTKSLMITDSRSTRSLRSMCSPQNDRRQGSR
jgi:hypothetical protein